MMFNLFGMFSRKEQVSIATTDSEQTVRSVSEEPSFELDNESVMRSDSIGGDDVSQSESVDISVAVISPSESTVTIVPDMIEAPPPTPVTTHSNEVGVRRLSSTDRPLVMNTNSWIAYSGGNMPTPPPSSISIAGLLNSSAGAPEVKALRAREVARQRSRRTGDRVKAKISVLKKREVAKNAVHLSMKDTMLAQAVGDGDGDFSVINVSKDDNSSLSDSFEDEDEEDRKYSRLSVEVALTDLVRGPMRKARVGDFEVIPSLPSVLVYDDKAFSDSVFEEAWEHIHIFTTGTKQPSEQSIELKDQDDSDPEPLPVVTLVSRNDRPSYAEIVACTRT